MRRFDSKVLLGVMVLGLLSGSLVVMEAAAADQGTSDEAALANANNPLANMNALNFQNWSADC